MSFLAEDRAVASILFVTSLPMFLVLAGLAIDGGGAYSMQAVLQNTADSAALAAALDLRTSPNATIWSQAQTYAWNNLPNNPQHGNVLQTADITIGHWDFPSSTYESCSSSSTLQTVSLTCSDNNPINAVRVLVRRERSNGNAFPISFLKLMGWDHWDVSALAIAAIPGDQGDCLVSTNSQNTTAAIQVNNGAGTLNLANCGMALDSTSNSALSVGNAKVTTSHVTFVAPGPLQYLNNPNAKVVAAVETNAAPAHDPYARIPEPSAGACTFTNAAPPSGSIVQPGTYCSSNGHPALQLSGPTQLNSGTYYIVGNSLSISAGAQITQAGASGVQIVLTDSSTEGWGSLNLGNGVSLSFSAPTTGNWAGIAILADPAGQNISISFGQTQTLDINGAIYAPNLSITLNNSFTTNGCLVLIANTISINNGVSWNNTCSESSPVLAAGHVALVQ